MEVVTRITFFTVYEYILGPPLSHEHSKNPLAECGWDLAERLERLTANAKVATVLGSIPASFDTVESKGRQMKQCWIKYTEKKT
jgi:hypothetical protein